MSSSPSLAVSSVCSFRANSGPTLRARLPGAAARDTRTSDTAATPDCDNACNQAGTRGIIQNAGDGILLIEKICRPHTIKLSPKTSISHFYLACILFTKRNNIVVIIIIII